MQWARCMRAAIFAQRTCKEELVIRWTNASKGSTGDAERSSACDTYSLAWRREPRERCQRRLEPDEQHDSAVGEGPAVREYARGVGKVRHSIDLAILGSEIDADCLDLQAIQRGRVSALRDG